MLDGRDGPRWPLTATRLSTRRASSHLVDDEEDGHDKERQVQHVPAVLGASQRVEPPHRSTEQVAGRQEPVIQTVEYPVVLSHVIADFNRDASQCRHFPRKQPDLVIILLLHVALVRCGARLRMSKELHDQNLTGSHCGRTGSRELPWRTCAYLCGGPPLHAECPCGELAAVPAARPAARGALNLDTIVASPLDRAPPTPVARLPVADARRRQCWRHTPRLAQRGQAEDRQLIARTSSRPA
eukprot:scaffold14790_cov138-Isochrysis_galbana.AAC.5